MFAFRALHIRVVNPEGVCLTETQSPLLKSLSIKNLSQKIHLDRFCRDNLSPIHIEQKANAFSVSLTKDIQIEGIRISASESLETSRMTYEWKSIPSALKLILPNRSTIYINSSSVTIYDFLAKASPILFALGLHFLILIAALLPLTTKIDQPKKISIDLISPSKLETLNKIDSKTYTQNLIDDFHISSKKSSRKKNPNVRRVANRNAFSKRVSFSQSTWNVDNIETKKLTTKLNLTENQIRSALSQIYPDLKNCYEKSLSIDAGLRGQPQLTLNINSNGEVADVLLAHLSARPEITQKLRFCFVQVLAKLKLPKPNQAFQVVQTLVLNH